LATRRSRPRGWHEGSRAWLTTLGDALRFRYDTASDWNAALSSALEDQLRTDGMKERRARDRVTLRCCRLAVLLVAQMKQQDAARYLGVSERTAKRDAQRLRRVVESGAL